MYLYLFLDILYSVLKRSVSSSDDLITLLSPSTNHLPAPTLVPRLGGAIAVDSKGRTNQGRVELNYNSKGWGTVCQNGWTINAANVVCIMLGFGSAQSFTTGSSYGPGVGRLWFDGVLCDGTESSLLACSYSGPGVSSCDHTQEVGVTCWGKHTCIHMYIKCS